MTYSNRSLIQVLDSLPVGIQTCKRDESFFHSIFISFATRGRQAQPIQGGVGKMADGNGYRKCYLLAYKRDRDANFRLIRLNET